MYLPGTHIAPRIFTAKKKEENEDSDDDTQVDGNYGQE